MLIGFTDMACVFIAILSQFIDFDCA